MNDHPQYDRRPPNSAPGPKAQYTVLVRMRAQVRLLQHQVAQLSGSLTCKDCRREFDKQNLD